MKTLLCFGRFLRRKRGRHKRIEMKKVIKKDKEGPRRGEEKGYCFNTQNLLQNYLIH